jgi:hypothetical protein
VTSLKISKWRPQKTYYSMLERSNKYHVISIAKKTLLMQYIGLELSNKALFVNKLSNSDFCDRIP